MGSLFWGLTGGVLALLLLIGLSPCLVPRYCGFLGRKHRVHVHNVQVGDYGLSHNGVLIWRRQAAAMEMQMDSAYDRPYRKGRTRGRRR